MKRQIEYNYLFLGVGGLLTHHWFVEATHTLEEYPAFDLEGDQSNLPDVYEYLTINSIKDHTMGFDMGAINTKDIPKELLHDIIEQGRKIANEQRERIYTSEER